MKTTCLAMLQVWYFGLKLRRHRYYLLHPPFSLRRTQTTPHQTTSTYIHTYTHAHTYTHIYTHSHTLTYTRTHKHTHTYTHTSTPPTHTHTKHTQRHTNIYTHKYTHTYIHTYSTHNQGQGPNILDHDKGSAPYSEMHSFFMSMFWNSAMNRQRMRNFLYPISTCFPWWDVSSLSTTIVRECDVQEWNRANDIYFLRHLIFYFIFEWSINNAKDPRGRQREKGKIVFNIFAFGVSALRLKKNAPLSSVNLFNC